MDKLYTTIFMVALIAISKKS